MKQILFLCVALSLFACGTSKKALTQTASLNEVLTALDNSYARAASILQAKKILLKGATVSFNTVKTNTTGAEIKILIFKIGRTISREKETSVTFDFTPGAATEALDAGDELANLIVKATEAFYEAKPPTGLKADNFTIDLGFAISRTSSTAVEFTAFSSDIGVSRDWDRKAAHKLSIKFAKP